MWGTLFWSCVGAIIYTYAGYPAVLAVLARVLPKARGKRYGDGDELPSVTLLIAAYNEEAIIARKIENSLQLDYAPGQLQILVAADGSDDATPQIAARYAAQGVELSYNPTRRGKMAAINRAMTQARGAIVVFSDANNMYAPDALRWLIAPFADPTVGATTGAKLIAHDDGALSASEGLYWRYESFIKQQESLLGSCTGVVGEILAIRRELFEYPPEQIINDDFYIAMRLLKRGWRVVYVPQARSSEPVSLSSADEITRRSRIIVGRYQAIVLAPMWIPLQRPLLVWQIVSHKLLRPLVPLAMLGAALSNVAALLFRRTPGKHAIWRLAPPFNWIMLLGQMGFYLLAAIGRRHKSGNLVGRLLYLPTFLVDSNLAAVQGLYRYLRKQRSVLWQRVRRGEIM